MTSNTIKPQRVMTRSLCLLPANLQPSNTKNESYAQVCSVFRYMGPNLRSSSMVHALLMEQGWSVTVTSQQWNHKKVLVG